MDIQLLCIVFVFAILIFLEWIDNIGSINEKFAVVRKGYKNTSPFLDIRYDPIPYSVNLANKDRAFGNIGAFGSYPANPLCPSCKLDRNVVMDPYLHANDLGDENGDLFGKVGIKCYGRRGCSNVGGKNYDDLSLPFLVAGRSAGRTRQCRRLL